MSSILAWTLRTTGNRIREKHCAERGGKGKLGVCWSSLTTAGRGARSTERDWNRLFLGLPPCPLAHIQSCIIHTVHYLPSSISVGHSRAQLYSPHWDLWIHGLVSYSDTREMGGGWEFYTEPSQRGLQEKMAASVVVCWFLECAIVMWLECALAAAGWEVRAWTV